MKIAVLASPEDATVILPLLEAFRAIDVPAYALKISRTWERLSRAEIGLRVGSASHFLVVCSAATMASSWFPFAVGYSLGRSRSLALYRCDPSWTPPAYIARHPLFDSFEELAGYYQAEKAEWFVKEARRVARATLLELGISFHAESFAEIVAQGDLRAVELFLRAGLLPDSRDRHGVPLLCLAARGKHRNVAEALLEFGAKLDAQSEDRGYSPLMDAVMSGAAELVELFLTRGADPNLQSKDGQTALVIAAGRGDGPISRRLLDYGADPDLMDKLGMSARGYARLFRNQELLELFDAADGVGTQAPHN